MNTSLGSGFQTTAQPFVISSLKKSRNISSKNITTRDSTKSPLSNLSTNAIKDDKKLNQELEDKLRWSAIFDDMMESCLKSPQHIAFESHMPLFFHSNRALFWEKRQNSNSFISRTLKSEVSASCSLMQQIINSNKPIIPDLIYDPDIIISFSLQSFDHQFFIPFRYPDGTICAIIQLSRHQNYFPFGAEEFKIANFIMKKFIIYGSPFFQKERIVGLASKVSLIGPLSRTSTQIKKTLESSFHCNFPDIWFLQLSDDGYFRYDDKIKEFIGVYKCSVGVVGHSLRNTNSNGVFTINSPKSGDVKHFSSSSDGDPRNPILMSSIEFEGIIWCIALRGERSIGPYTNDDQNRLSSIVPFIARSLSFSGGFSRQSLSNEKKSTNLKLKMVDAAASIINNEFDILGFINLVQEKGSEILTSEICRVLIVDDLNKNFQSDFEDGFENCKKNPLDKGFAGLTVLNKEPIIASNPEDDSKFDRDVDVGKSIKIKNLLSVPVFDNKNNVFAVLITLNKENGEFNDSDKSKLVTLASFFGIALKNAKSYHSSLHILSHLNEFLKRQYSKSESSKESIEKVLQKIKEIINASNLTLFIVFQSDSSLHEFISVGEKSQYGTQYSTFSIESKRSVTFSIKPPDDEQNEIDMVCCVPIFDEETIIGVIEFSCNSSEFNDQISFIESFVTIIVSSSSLLDKKYLKEVSNCEEEKMKMSEIIGIENMNLYETPNSLLCSIESTQLFDATFIPHGNSEIDLMKIVFKCFDQYKLKQEFKFNNQQLYSFISNISKTYKNDSYYNWSHAVSTCLFCLVLLMKSKLDEKFNKMEIFSLIVAALGHDSGKNDEIENESENEIPFSILLKKQSFIEINHCTKLINILSKKSCNLLSNVKDKDKNVIWELIIYLILQTDMAKHFDILNQYEKIQKENKFSFNNKEDRKLQLAIFLKCADLSDCIRNFDHFNSLKIFIADEFFKQGQIEKVKGMMFTCDQNKRKFIDQENSLQSFFKFVALPLFEIVSEYTKELQYIKEYYISNLEKLNENNVLSSESGQEKKDENDDGENDKQETKQTENENDKLESSQTEDENIKNESKQEEGDNDKQETKQEENENENN